MACVLVQIAVGDNAGATKLVELPLPLTHANLLDAARKKFKSVTKQSRLFDGVSGAEIEVGCEEVTLMSGAKVICSRKAGWKGAERLRESHAAETPAMAADLEPSSSGEAAVLAAWASPRAEERATVPPLQLQFVSFSYDRGQPNDTLANLNARSLPNPGKAAKGRTGLDRRLAREVLATPGAAELCEALQQEVLQQLQRLAESGHSPSAPVRVGVGCDRGRHRSVAVAEVPPRLIVELCLLAFSSSASPANFILLSEHPARSTRTLAGGDGAAGAAVREGALRPQPARAGGAAQGGR